MNTDKVFTAFDKEGNELLLYRKDSETYIDLTSDNNEVFPKNNIDMESLVLARKGLNLHKHMLASSIKRKYTKDRNKLVEAKKYLIGLKRVVTNLQVKEEDSGLRYYNIPVLPAVSYSWQGVPTTYGLYEFLEEINVNGDKFKVYKNLYDQSEYIGFFGKTKNISSLPTFENGMEYVILTDKTAFDVLKETYVEKKLIYDGVNQLRKGQSK